jgi:LacI family transcriptional regulator
MNVTLRDIAERAKTSVSTVSRVLNKKSENYRISKETERLVLQAAKVLNYRPNQVARGLRLKRTHTIGLVAPDVSNPFFAYLIKSIQNAAHELGYSVIVCDTDETPSLEVEHISLLRSKAADGLIVMPVGQKASHLEELLHEEVPLVLVDRCFDELEVSSVSVDNYAGALEAVEFLIRHGHSRIGIIQGLPNTSTCEGRWQGYRDAHLKYNLPIDETLVVGGDFRKETGYVATKLLLNLNDPPTAIFATSDFITLGVLEALVEEGLSIPKDISLVAFDDIDFAPFLICPLTTVAQPKEVMGEIAVKLLAEQLRPGAKKEPRRIVLKPRLVVRQSVRRLESVKQGELSMAHPLSS